MDIALCIERLVKSAKYGGSTTANTKEAYDKLRWEDIRKKPSWEELVAVSGEIEQDIIKQKETEQLEAKIQAEMRSVAIQNLQNKGEITKEQADKLKERGYENKGD